METSTIKFKSVDEYISTFPHHIKNLLENIRQAIKSAAPSAEEIISYNMPAYRYHGNLVYFAGYKGHIGFYPGSAVVTNAFKEKLVNYKTSKGAIQFPIDKPIPVSLVKSIVKHRIKDNLEREKAKLKKKK